MKVMFGCVCDHASVDQGGKLNINGVFDRIGTSRFPATHPRMVLVFRLLLEYEDNDRPHELTCRLEDADGQELLKAEAAVEHPRVEPGDFRTLNQIVQMENIGFQKPGRYRFLFTLGRAAVYEVPFEVVGL